MNIKLKYQEGGVAQDNTRVQKPQIVLPFKLSREQLAKQLVKKNQARIYDKDKADYYRNLQRAYNSNFFGFGVFGNQTNYDSTTQEGQKAIESNFDYARSNAMNTMANLVLTGATAQIGSTIRGFTPFTNGRRTIGTMDQVNKLKKIGKGSEAIVAKDSPFTVLKVFQSGGHGSIEAKNNIPGFMKLNFKGYIKDGSQRMSTFTQQMGKPIKDKEYFKAVKSITKKMKRQGFEKVKDDSNPTDNVFVNWNKQQAIGEIDKSKIMKDWLNRFRISDAVSFSVPEWLDLGYTLTPIK